MTTAQAPQVKDAKTSATEDGSAPVLPNKLKEYYAQFNIDIGDCIAKNGAPTRFVRLNPRYDKDETLAVIRAELSEQSLARGFPKRVPWLLNNHENSINGNQSASGGTFSWGFYALPAEFSLSQSKAYQTGRIYGQDVSSGAAVAYLMDDSSETTTTSSSRILDLCCAPGLKLCAMADWLEHNHQTKQQQQQQPPATIIGVDLSESRLDVAKNVIHKYQIDSETRGGKSLSSHCNENNTTPSDEPTTNAPLIRLYRGDGTSFARRSALTDRSSAPDHMLVFDSNAAREEQTEACKAGRKRSNKSSRARARKRLKVLHEQDRSNSEGKLDLFDRVLVDAECSTDGSLKHVQKWLETPAGGNLGGGILPLLDDPTKMDSLVCLQKQLALRGFDLLKPGGFMVYSTCSLSKRQNEEVVEALLEARNTAKLIPIDIQQFGQSSLVLEGSTQGTVRFLPNQGSEQFFGGGFFLAKLQKVKNES